MRKSNRTGKQKLIKKCNANHVLRHNIGQALFFYSNGDPDVNSFDKRDRQCKKACRYV